MEAIVDASNETIWATAFRQWATSVLEQYMLKGYVVNHNIDSEDC
ncbi:MAG: hypothetical protein E7111_05400 [Bacteroidales bacterium]|nr:hypothetical protein [Bacteroidales bacterium]